VGEAARLTEHLDHASERSVYSASHVQRFNGNPGGIDADHFMSARSNTATQQQSALARL
jgi:hypothetical protein